MEGRREALVRAVGNPSKARRLGTMAKPADPRVLEELPVDEPRVWTSFRGATSVVRPVTSSLIERHDLHRRVTHFLEESIERRAFPEDLESRSS